MWRDPLKIRKLRFCYPVFTWISLLSPSGAQSLPSFEVASIKPSNADGPVSLGVGNGKGGGRNVTVRMLVALAYRLQEFAISGGPGWLATDRFDVEGKTENPTAGPDQLRLMLQSLLKDRFQLKVHHETRISPVYALLTRKAGPRLKPSADQTSETVNGPAPPGAGPNRGAVRFGEGSMIGNAVTLSLFAQMLSQRLDRPVIDKTNLPGRFDFQLQWTPEIGEAPFGPGGNPLPPTDSHFQGPSIFTALQQQLGLKLTPSKGPVDFLVMDQIERPSDN